jgi:predicted nucleic-acid-binding protein
MEIWVITDWMGCVLGAYSTSERALVEVIENIMGLEWLDNIDKKNAIIQLTKNYSDNPNDFNCYCQEENECPLYVERVEVDKE